MSDEDGFDMLHRLLRMFTTRASRRAARGGVLSLRYSARLERLEDRAMLSASYGAVPHPYGDYGSPPAVGGMSSYGDAPMLAAPAPSASHAGSQSSAMWIDGAPTSSGSEYYSGMHDPPLRLEGLGAPPEVWHYSVTTTRYEWGYVQYQMVWREVPPSSAAPLSTSSLKPPNILPTPWDAPAQTAGMIVRAAGRAPQDPIGVPERPPTQSHDWLPSINLGAPSLPTVPTAVVTVRPATATRPSISATIDAPATGAIALAASLPAIPTASQIIAAQSNPVAALSASAREVAFQNYGPQLLLMTTNGASEPMHGKAAVTESAPSGEVNGDFIQISAVPVADANTVSNETARQEREAVDAVLRQLHDVHSLLDPTADANLHNGVDSAQAEVTADASTIEIAAEAISDAQGGMVLLEATGDPNESAFDLAAVYDDNLDTLQVDTGVEAAVGFYQAVDVAADELPAPGGAPVTIPAAESARRSEGDERVSAKIQPASTSKAAAFLGATTFVGALLSNTLVKRDDELDASSVNVLRRGDAS